MDRSFSGPQFNLDDVGDGFRIFVLPEPEDDESETVQVPVGVLVAYLVPRELFEPRLVSIARGTGEVDAVYHVAFDALGESVADTDNRHQQESWEECVSHGRVRPYSELAAHLIQH